MNHQYLAAQKKEITKEVYAYIIQYFREHGYAPSNKEIAESIAVSTHTVERRINELLDAGLLKTEHRGVSRAYRLTNYEFRRKKGEK